MATCAYKHGAPAPPDEYASLAPVNRGRACSRCSITAAVPYVVWGADEGAASSLRQHPSDRTSPRRLFLSSMEGTTGAQLGSSGARSGWAGRSADPRDSVVLSDYPVETDLMSTLPKVAGQSRSGHGAPGSTSAPAANDAARHDCTASQTEALKADAQTPIPYVADAAA